MTSPAEEAVTAAPIVPYATVQLGFTLRLGTQRTVTPASAFAPPARRTSTEARAAENAKRLLSFNVIRTLFIESPCPFNAKLDFLAPRHHHTWANLLPPQESPDNSA